jgi:hypothetical protein
MCQCHTRSCVHGAALRRRGSSLSPFPARGHACSRLAKGHRERSIATLPFMPWRGIGEDVILFFLCYRGSGGANGGGGRACDGAKRTCNVVGRARECAACAIECKERPCDCLEQAIDWAERPIDCTEQPIDWAEHPIDGAERAIDWTERPIEWAEQPLRWAEHNKPIIGTRATSRAVYRGPRRGLVGSGGAPPRCRAPSRPRTTGSIGQNGFTRRPRPPAHPSAPGAHACDGRDLWCAGCENMSTAPRSTQT